MTTHELKILPEHYSVGSTGSQEGRASKVRQRFSGWRSACLTVLGSCRWCLHGAQRVRTITYVADVGE